MAQNNEKVYNKSTNLLIVDIIIRYSIKFLFLVNDKLVDIK